MKIVLHLINSKVFSGLESVACDIIQNTSNIYKHIYVTQEGPIIEILKEKNIRYEIIKKMSISELKRVVKKYNANIIHAHDFTASCISALSMTKIPIISHLHQNPVWLKKINIKTVLYLICSFRLKKIITVSDSIDKEYIFSKFINSKIECIGNPISVEKVRNKVSKDEYDKKYDICFVGRLTEAKNPLRWLDIIYEVKQEYPDIKCIWVGDGELKQEFVNKMEKLDLQKNVEMPGFQKNPYNFLAASKIFLQTSSWEGFGLSAFESLVLGVPAVVSNVGGLPIIVDNTCGMLCDNDKDFIDLIIKLLNNKRLYNNYVMNALKRADELDNLEDYLIKIKNIYNNF